MSAGDIPVSSLLLLALLLLVPALISAIFRLHILKSLGISLMRMVLQLSLVGIFLEYIFELNHPGVNLLWVMIMILTASLTVIRSSELRLRYLLGPVLASLGTTLVAVLLYFNLLVAGLAELFSARYLIPIGGMLLGNSLRANVVALNRFFHALDEQKDQFHWRLSLGAGRFEASLPFFRSSLKLALSPSVATMATMGIVSLPGMMTGQILGGSPPATAVKYQIAIMIAIFTVISVSVTASILLSQRLSFTRHGTLKPGILNRSP